MTSSEDGTVDLAIDGAVATITINRPKVRNSINIATAKRLVEIVMEIEETPAVRVAILTGAGNVAFSAGADMRARAAGEPRATFPPYGFAGFVRRPRTKPYIAAVNGYAFGGGLELAMACELVVASPSATFALPEPLRGLVAGGDCLPLALSRLPAAVAWDVALTGRRIEAKEALACGMINGISDDVMQAARELAGKIAMCAPKAVGATMQLMRALLQKGPDGYDDLVEKTQAGLSRSRDAAEGAAAFLEKREPVWSGS